MNFGNKLLQDEKTTSVKMFESLSYLTNNELFLGYLPLHLTLTEAVAVTGEKGISNQFFTNFAQLYTE